MESVFQHHSSYGTSSRGKVSSLVIPPFFMTSETVSSTTMPYHQVIKNNLAITCVWEDGVFGTPLANNSIKCSPLLALKVLLSDIRCLVGALSQHYMIALFKLFSYTYIFQESSAVMDFHMTFQLAFNVSQFFLPTPFSSSCNSLIIVSFYILYFIYYSFLLSLYISFMLPWKIPSSSWPLPYLTSVVIWIETHICKAQILTSTCNICVWALCHLAQDDCFCLHSFNFKFYNFILTAA